MLAHGSVPETAGWQTDVLGMHAGTFAPAPIERMRTVLAWVQQVHIVSKAPARQHRNMIGSGVDAPPMQSRMHQVLSNSMLGYG